MEDLIYSFLLQSNFPRASIIFDVDLLGLSAKVDSGLQAPTFVIVDPDTADPLATIQVVDALDIGALKQVAIETGAYASRLAGKFVQGYVIRVDVRGRSEAEQVQFYRIWPNSTLHQLSSKNFPDLEALRVSRKIMVNATARAVETVTPVVGTIEGFDDEETLNEQVRYRPSSAGLYVPALVLMLLIFADGMLETFKGVALLTIPQSILALGAAALFSVPAAIRNLRQ